MSIDTTTFVDKRNQFPALKSHRFRFSLIIYNDNGIYFESLGNRRTHFDFDRIAEHIIAIKKKKNTLGEYSAHFVSFARRFPFPTETLLPSPVFRFNPSMLCTLNVYSADGCTATSMTSFSRCRWSRKYVTVYLFLTELCITRRLFCHLFAIIMVVILYYSQNLVFYR